MNSPFKKNIQPVLLNINLPISRGNSSAFNSTSDNMGAVKNNLMCLLSTRKGERVFSSFGSNLPNMIFEPNDKQTENNIYEEIRNSVQQWMPYLEVVETKVTKTTNDRQINVFIRYKLIESQYEDSVNILL